MAEAHRPNRWELRKGELTYILNADAVLLTPQGDCQVWFRGGWVVRSKHLFTAWILQLRHNHGVVSCHKSPWPSWIWSNGGPQGVLSEGVLSPVRTKLNMQPSHTCTCFYQGRSTPSMMQLLRLHGWHMMQCSAIADLDLLTCMICKKHAASAPPFKACQLACQNMYVRFANYETSCSCVCSPNKLGLCSWTNPACWHTWCKTCYVRLGMLLIMPMILHLQHRCQHRDSAVGRMKLGIDSMK